MLNSATLSQLSVFVRIVESGSFTKAAKELGLSPSAVSKSLAKLEEQLGTLLIKRTTRNFYLTVHGETIFNRAIMLLDECEDMISKVRCIVEPEGNLRISCSVAYGSKVLPALVTDYQMKFPKVKIHLDLNDDVINLSETNFDMVIRITKKLNESANIFPLGDVKWLYCCTPQYLEGKPSIIIPDDLRQHRCLTNPIATFHDNWVFSKDDSDIMIPIDSCVTSNSSLTLLDIILNHNGVSCLPDYLASIYIELGRLVHILPEYDAGISHRLYLIERKNKFINTLSRTFIDHMLGCKSKN